MRLADKIILITGSATGIGEAIARRCVAEGARVVIHGLDVERGSAVAQSLGERAIFIGGDLAEAATPPALIEKTVAHFGRLDGLVNNAALIVRSNLKTTDVALFDRVMAVNVRAPMFLIAAALPHLKAAKGCVLNIGSVNAYTGEPNLLPYSVSKGALMTLSRNLADALCREGVRVNHFNLGWVLSEAEYQTKIADGQPADWPQRLPRAYAPSGRILLPAEIAAASVYWLSDESRPVSGSVLEIEQYPIIGRNPSKED
jgi:NAD(P)-dependent dehydrogenase (short-subunit alcohol dehydrogenase family)